MKTISLIIAFIISNLIVVQSVYFTDEHAVLNDTYANPNLILMKNNNHELNIYYLHYYLLSSELVTLIPEIVNA